MVTRIVGWCVLLLLNIKILQGFQGLDRITTTYQLKLTHSMMSRYRCGHGGSKGVLYAINPENKIIDNPSTEDKAPIESESDAMILDWDNEHLTEVFAFILKSGLIGTFTGLSVVWFKSGIAAASTLFYEDLANILPKPYFYWPIVLCKLILYHFLFFFHILPVDPLIGSMIVSLLVFWKGDNIRKGIDSIARSIDSTDYAWNRKKTDVTAIESTAIGTTVEERVDEVYNVTTSAVTAKPAVEMPVGIYPSQNKNSEACQAGIVDINSGLDTYNPAFDPWNQVVRLLGAIATLGSGCSLGPEVNLF